MSENSIRLTQYSHGAGCGCKISPKVLETILHSEQAKFVDPNLLVGNETRDDAAVYDLGNGTSVISTTDFFMPIVDNPFDFGRIAATNAISDIFAMGGKPIMAIAILGWPINKLSPEIAREVTEGGRYACRQAGIALAGGHSIDAPEPIFGLAVTGIVPTERGEEKQYCTSRMQTVPDETAGDRRSHHSREKIAAETGTSGTGDGSDVPDEYCRRVLCQYRRRKSDDRRYWFWSAGPFERNVSGCWCAGARRL
ncbi:selenophosphate synthetase [Escherichia fergusonii]|nr:selenophosphate synthetase [Escherichia fergusonii]